MLGAVNRIGLGKDREKCVDICKMRFVFLMCIVLIRRLSL